MKIIKAKDYNDMSRKAANLIAAQIMFNNESVLGLATGDTVIGIYKLLVQKCKDGDINFNRIKSVNLDEYVGLSGDNENSYRYYMNTNLFNDVNILKENTNLPDGKAASLVDECIRYDSLIEALGGIDLQLLGLGTNGHIGFNEPDEAFPKGTQAVKLKESTIKSNAHLFSDQNEVPREALTMGIKTIMQSKKIVLCASGKHKADILEKVITGPITPKVPGSILQMHNDVTIIGDVESLYWYK